MGNFYSLLITVRRITNLLLSRTDLVMTFISVPVFQKMVCLFMSSIQTLIQENSMKDYCSIELNPFGFFSKSALMQNLTTSSKDKSFVSDFSTDSEEDSKSLIIKLTFRFRICRLISIVSNDSLNRFTTFWFFFSPTPFHQLICFCLWSFLVWFFFFFFFFFFFDVRHIFISYSRLLFQV